MRWQRIVAILGCLVLLGDTCSFPAPYRRAMPDVPSSMREVISLPTSDGVSLVGNWYPVDRPRGWTLLLHMMPATKESYDTLATELQRRGIASLAIDFRGHGASQGGPTGYEQFSDAEQQTKRNDVAAAYAWMRDRTKASWIIDDATPAIEFDRRLVIVGASIGANLGLESLTRRESISAAVLLSPGLDYRGVQTEPLARRVGATQRVLLAAGGADDEYSTTAVRTLTEILGDRATVRMFDRGGHGTMMFERTPAFLSEIAEWISARIPER